MSNALPTLPEETTLRAALVALPRHERRHHILNVALRAMAWGFTHFTWKDSTFHARNAVKQARHMVVVLENFRAERVTLESVILSSEKLEWAEVAYAYDHTPMERRAMNLTVAALSVVEMLDARTETGAIDAAMRVVMYVESACNTLAGRDLKEHEYAAMLEERARIYAELVPAALNTVH